MTLKGQQDYAQSLATINSKLECRVEEYERVYVTLSSSIEFALNRVPCSRLESLRAEIAQKEHELTNASSIHDEIGRAHV